MSQVLAGWHNTWEEYLASPGSRVRNVCLSQPIILTLYTAYCLSVFTHIHEHWEAWLQEIKRVLVPGGILLSTFHSRVAYEGILHKRFNEQTVGMEAHWKNRTWDLGGPQVFHSNWWVMEEWSRFLPVQYIIREGLIGWQSVAVMQKGGAVNRQEQIRTIQPFPHVTNSSDFFGNIEYDVLASSCWLLEWGMLCGDSAEFTGWFISGVGPTVQLDFFVDQLKVLPRVVRQERPDVSQHHPTIPRSPNWPPGFRAVLNMSSFGLGAHDARVTALDGAGRKCSIDFTIFKRIQ
jgi:SAM-dependent methyltransferase